MARVIVVDAVAPGYIATPGSPGPPRGADDIGRAVLFLASDLASSITGAQLVVDGGMLLT